MKFNHLFYYFLFHIMFSKYLAGNNINKVIKTANNILSINKIPVINYAIENTNNGIKTFNEYENIWNNIDNKYRVALKLSSFDFDKSLTYDIIDMYKEKDIKILIDAEDNKLNDKYHNMVNELILRYNTNDPLIIKTYQMYRKDSLNILNEDIINFKDIYLGTKLVRGAYWNSEVRDGHLYDNKNDTDLNYNNGIIKLFNSDIKSLNILATHNSKSIDLGYLLNMEKPVFEFGHLLGMKDKKYNELLLDNEKINVYLPYGPYSKMIPYLMRRLYENLDTIKYMYH